MNNIMCFNEQLKWGELAETQICKWLNMHDNISVMRVWAKINDNKQIAPKIKIDDKYYSTPDIEIIVGKKRIFIESKRQIGFSKFRKTNKWQLSLDKIKYEEYKFIERVLNQETIIFFLVDGKKVVGTDELYDNGLYKMYLNELPDHAHYDDDFKKVMLYFNESQIEKVAEYDYIMSL